VNRRHLATLLFALGLSACGGGSDAASTDTAGSGHRGGDPNGGDPNGGNTERKPGTPTPTPPPTTVIAHRGASGHLPEHTLGGYELAIRMGADLLDIDLQLSRDGVVVAMHDTTLDRTTDVASKFARRNGGYAVAQFTAAEIKTLQVRPTGSAASSYPGFTPSAAQPWAVPTFQEVIDLVRSQEAATGRRIGLSPEAKVADPVLEDALLSILVANGYGSSTDSVLIQSFMVTALKRMRTTQARLGSHMPMMLLGAALPAGTNAGTDAVQLLNSQGGTQALADVKAYADAVGLKINDDRAGHPITQAFVDQVHACGLKALAWTFSRADAAGARAEFDRYLSLGLDGVVADFPDRVRSQSGPHG
jgi:glycerophosphoryl diester phosphodiesterase